MNLATVTAAEYQAAHLEVTTDMVDSIVNCSRREVEHVLASDSPRCFTSSVISIDDLPEKWMPWNKLSYMEREILGKLSAARLQHMYRAKVDSIRHERGEMFSITYKTSATGAVQGQKRSRPHDSSSKDPLEPETIKKPAKKRSRVY